MTTEATTCVHWWVIPTAAGPTSIGKCKRCRETRVFFNVYALDQPGTTATQRHRGRVQSVPVVMQVYD